MATRKLLTVRPFVILTVVILVAGCGDHRNALEESSPAGKFFRQNCAACHGIDAEGRQIGAKPVPSLKAGRALTDTDDRLRQQIENGGGGMPPFRYQLTAEQVDDMVRFIRGIQH